MRLLKGIAYDPGTAVAKATSSLIAMTALDTTNLRAAVTIPASGVVLIRMRTCLQGANTFPQVMLGAMNGSTIIGRITPVANINGTALATTRVGLFGEFVCSGLTPGAMNIDAAYGVELLVAATNIQYGGPNDTTTNNAWGAFCFEVWDPDPISITAGAVNSVLTVTNLTNAPTSGDLTSTMKTSVTTAATAATPIAASVTGAVGSVTGNVSGNVTGSVGSVIGSVGSVSGLTASNLDATISSRMASYAQPTGFLAATFPSGTIANTTNITGGTITTATNLTNAPTAGDLTATMKTSVTTACSASTPSATIAGYIPPANNRLRRLQSTR
jgi:hypothetical protein